MSDHASKPKDCAERGALTPSEITAILARLPKPEEVTTSEWRDASHLHFQWAGEYDHHLDLAAALLSLVRKQDEELAEYERTLEIERGRTTKMARAKVFGADERVTAQLSAAQARVKVLEEALKYTQEWLWNPDEGANAQFERIGDMYRRATLFLRPGKDDPNHDSSSKENHERFRRWCESRNRECHKRMSAALRGTETKETT